ncbi:MAG: hypothetical protein QM785_04925 [Pyrinomonadaceae bacterium]
MRIAATALVIVAAAIAASAQAALKLVPRKYSEVEIALGKRSVIFDLDDSLIGSNGSLPGNPPHKYRTLFTAEKDGFFYLVANVRSASPISNPMAPCGGDSPQSILWIKADKSLKKREVQSEIYASCSYNYYDSKLAISKIGLVAKYGGSQKLELTYDNRSPEKGLVVTKKQ